MKILIVGLGLIGGSYAEGLRQKGHEVFGFDSNETVMKRAIDLKLIENQSLESALKHAELIILCLYPVDNLEFVKTHQHTFKKGQIITDVSGTKEVIVKEIEKYIRTDVSYTSHHPMAGRETKGFDAREKNLFLGANFIIVETRHTKENDIKVLKQLAQDLSFGHVIIVDSKTHDALIAYTSQLTHVLAVALVNSDMHAYTKFATGDSYRDLTRIAKINAELWSELFLENQEALTQEIERFETEIGKMKTLIQTKDREALIEALDRAKKKRGLFDVH